MNIVKTVARRDSATAILRKIGIKPRDYNAFIKETADEKFAVDVTAAEKHLKNLLGPTEEEKAKAAEQAKLTAQALELRDQLKVVVTKARVAEKRVDAYRKRKVDANKVVNPVKIKPLEGERCKRYVYRLIDAGHSNIEIWEAIKREFNLDDKKRLYPAWYRWEKAKGELEE